MTLPLLGPMTLSGFEHPWFFVFLLVVAGLVGLYIIVQVGRQKRILRFANMELLESVAPKRPNKWRHLPAILEDFQALGEQAEGICNFLAFAALHHQGNFTCLRVAHNGKSFVPDCLIVNAHFFTDIAPIKNVKRFTACDFTGLNLHMLQILRMPLPLLDIRLVIA